MEEAADALLKKVSDALVAGLEIEAQAAEAHIDHAVERLRLGEEPKAVLEELFASSWLSLCARVGAELARSAR